MEDHHQRPQLNASEACPHDSKSRADSSSANLAILANRPLGLAIECGKDAVTCMRTAVILSNFDAIEEAHETICG